MRTFWDQVVALVEQGEPPRGPRQANGAQRNGEEGSPGQRNDALRARCEDIEGALDQLERLRGLFQGFLSPVSELARDFEACGARLAEATAKLAALEATHRGLATSHAALTEERDRLAERCGRLEREGAMPRDVASSMNGASTAGEGRDFRAKETS